jgi:hypothetical protein
MARPVTEASSTAYIVVWEVSSMIPFMGYILLCYGVAAIAVHAMYRWHVHRHPKSVKRVHYVLITQNHENQMEWVLRALHWYSKIKGIALRVTLLDNESIDDTLAIAKKMQAHGMEITMMQVKDTEDEDNEDNFSKPSRQNGSVDETDGVLGAKAENGTGVNVVVDGTEIGEEKQFCIDLRLPQEVNQIPYVQI